MNKPVLALVSLAVTAICLAIPAMANDDPAAAQKARKPHEKEALPQVWNLTGSAKTEYEGGTDLTTLYGGKPSGYLKSTGLNLKGYGVLNSAQDATPYQGQTVRVAARVKTFKVQTWSGLWIGVETPSHPFKPSRTPTTWFNTMRDAQGLMGTLDWKPYSLDIVVPEDATRLLFGLAMSGRGTAFINDVSLTVVTPPIKPVAPSLDFKPSH